LLGQNQPPESSLPCAPTRVKSCSKVHKWITRRAIPVDACSVGWGAPRPGLRFQARSFTEEPRHCGASGFLRATPEYARLQGARFASDCVFFTGLYRPAAAFLLVFCSPPWRPEPIRSTASNFRGPRRRTVLLRRSVNVQAVTASSRRRSPTLLDVGPLTVEFPNRYKRTIPRLCRRSSYTVRKNRQVPIGRRGNIAI